MKLILVRHGNTIGNSIEKVEGHLDGELSELGKEQVKKLGLRLKEEQIDFIYCSDLKRAKDTLREITKYHDSVPIVYDKRLREMDAGEFTGKFQKDVDWSNPPESVETISNARKRAKEFLEEIISKHKNKTVLLVAHSFINKALITVILNESEDCVNKYPQQNTAVNILEFMEDENHKLHLLNCTKHLD